jgi:hypothetical protein
MRIIHKTTFNPVVSPSGDAEPENTLVTASEKAILEAVADGTVELLGEERDEREQQISELQLKIARLEGQVESLMALLQGKGQVVDLPPLPKIEASTERIVRKVTLTP